MTRLHIVVLACAVLTHPGMIVAPANAAEFLVFGEEWDGDKVSGYAGKTLRANAGEYTYEYSSPPPHVISASRETLEATTYAGLKGFSWRERGDKPCSITIHSALLNRAALADQLAEATHLPPEKIAGICSGGGNEKTVKLLSGPDQYVRGVAACTTDKKNSADNRLKGIRIYVAQLSADGTVKALNTFEDNKHNHCEKWHAPVYCPAAHLLTGLKLHYKDDTFTGLGIKCRKVLTADSPFKS